MTLFSLNNSSCFRWVVTVEGSTETLYEGEVFELMFKFGSRYPFESPMVSDVVANICLGSFQLVATPPMFLCIHPKYKETYISIYLGLIYIDT